MPEEKLTDRQKARVAQRKKRHDEKMRKGREG